MGGAMRGLAGGKTGSTGEAGRRLAALGAATLCLLLARLHIMGAQLPVFTRCAIIRCAFLTIMNSLYCMIYLSCCVADLIIQHPLLRRRRGNSHTTI